MASCSLRAVEPQYVGNPSSSYPCSLLNLRLLPAITTSGNSCDSERVLFFFFFLASEGAFAPPAEELRSGLALAALVVWPMLEEYEVA